MEHISKKTVLIARVNVIFGVTQDTLSRPLHFLKVINDLAVFLEKYIRVYRGVAFSSH